MGRRSGQRHRSRNVRNSPQQQNNAPADTQQPAAHHEPEGASINTPSVQPTSEDEQHKAAERGFWKRQIRVAKWLNWITGGAAIVGIIGLIFVYLSLGESKRAGDEAKRSSDIAAAALIAANRAWLQATGIVAAGEIGGDKDISIQVFYENAGKGPALHMISGFFAGTTANTKRDEFETISPGENKTCEGLNPVDGTEVFPNPMRQSWVQTVIYRKLILPSVQTNDGALYLQGCFVYRTMDETHHTWFCMTVYRNGRFSNLNATPLCQDGQGAD